MAMSSEYLGEAYEVLQKLSADDKKRIEYEAREKALRDYNALMNSAKRRGHLEGREEGLKEGMEKGRNEGIHEGIKLVRRVDSLHDKGATNEQIAQECMISVEEVDGILGTGHFSP